MPVQLSSLMLAVCLSSGCGHPVTESRAPPASIPPSFPSATAPATSSPHETPPRWVGARLEKSGLSLSVAERGADPRVVFTERPGTRSRSLAVTDVAYAAARDRVYVGTCCEPGSGHLWRIDMGRAAAGFVQDDQGFAVDAAGSAVARTDTFGTLGIRASASGAQTLRENAAVADVAVDGARGLRILALLQAKRLQALIPTVAPREAGLLVLQPKAGGGWTESFYPLPREETYCRVVALEDGRVGLLAGSVDRRNHSQCTGSRLDVWDTAQNRLQRGALTFPAPIRHLSIDESSRFLIFTTSEGAVGWRTLDGRGGALAARGFAAADW